MVKQTSLQDPTVKAWRWNVNPAWTNFSTMIQEAYMFENATTEYERHRASKACLYFGVAAVEAFKNQELRKNLKSKEMPKDEIYKIVSSSYPKKQKWLLETPFGKIENDPKSDRFMYYKDIRNEATHPSREDQLISDYLNIVNLREFVDVVKYIFVKICEYQGKEYQYWMLGWNYIGFNFNNNELFLGNNGNGFYHSFRAMHTPKLQSLSYDYFSEKYLRTYESFLHVQQMLNAHPFDIEPERNTFSRPYLTRKWWDNKILDKNNWESYATDPNKKGNILGWLVIDITQDKSLGFYSDKEKAIWMSEAMYAPTKVVYATANPQTLEAQPIKES